LPFKKTKKDLRFGNHKTLKETLIFPIFEKKFKLFTGRKKKDNASIDYLLLSIDGTWILLVPSIFGCHCDEINGLVSHGSMLNKGYIHQLLAGY
jgi:hypothetical protein